VCFERSLLAKVQRGRAAIREANHHEATATDVAGRRVGDRERQARRYRGIHRVAAFAQHLATNIARDGTGGNDHATFGHQRLIGRCARERSGCRRSRLRARCKRGQAE
jgi:hypothetical protein